MIDDRLDELLSHLPNEPPAPDLSARISRNRTARRLAINLINILTRYSPRQTSQEGIS
jgi:hypothetical protein